MKNKNQLRLENLEEWITPQIEQLSIKSKTLGGHDFSSDDSDFENS